MSLCPVLSEPSAPSSGTSRGRCGIGSESVTRPQECRNTLGGGRGGAVPNRPGSATGGGRRGGERRNEFTAVRGSSISKVGYKVLKILYISVRKMWGQRSVSTGRWAVKAASILVLGSVTHEVLLAQNSPYGSLVPIRGRLARRLLRVRKR